MKSNRELEKWLAQEIHGRKIPRKPPQRASTLHPRPWRSWKYRRWIQSLLSAVSGAMGCDPCHTGPHAFGVKASDATIIPLTRAEHEEYDANPAAFCQQHNLDVKALTRRLCRAWFNQWKIGL
jgi:hypothetical protein